MSEKDSATPPPPPSSETETTEDSAVSADKQLSDQWYRTKHSFVSRLFTLNIVKIAISMHSVNHDFNRRKAKGNEFYKAAKYQEAVAAYSKAIDLDKTNAALLTNRAAAYLMLLSYKEAKEDCDAAIALDDTNSKAYFRKATALKGLGRIDEAITALEQGLQHDPRSATALKDKEALIKAKDCIVQLRELFSQRKFTMVLAQIEALNREIGNASSELNLMKVEVYLELDRPQEAYNLTNTMVSAVLSQWARHAFSIMSLC